MKIILILISIQSRIEELRYMFTKTQDDAYRAHIRIVQLAQARIALSIL